MIRWLSRCVPGLSALCLIALLVLAFGDVDPSPRLPALFPQHVKYDPHHQDSSGPSPLRLKLSQKLFIFYTLLVHTDTALFALRLFFSVIVVTRKIRATLHRRHDLPSGFYSEGILQPVDSQERGIRSHQHDPDTVKLDQLSSADEVIHAIVIPNYQEDIDTLRMTLTVLAAHPRAATQYEVGSVCPSFRGSEILIILLSVVDLLGYGAKRKEFCRESLSFSVQFCLVFLGHSCDIPSKWFARRNCWQEL
jgi:hypothetical protein